eukprot:4412998-Prorocentrum_lima.AAC.1
MTSSLVGSEMCIRDRRSKSALAREVEPACTMWVMVWALRRSRCRAVWAVSYTHLTLPTICSV